MNYISWFKIVFLSKQNHVCWITINLQSAFASPNISGDKGRKFKNYINTTAAEALAPSIISPSVATILTI